MITDSGKTHIKRYLAGYVPTIAESISFGIGGAAEAASDKRLVFEIDKSIIELSYYDFINNRLVYRAALPDDYVGEIREIGLYSLEDSPSIEEYASRIITTFDSDFEDWLQEDLVTGSLFGSTETRVGADSLLQSPSANQTAKSALLDIELDLSGYSSSDEFVFALHLGNNNTSNVRYRFLTDNSNYYTISLGALNTGYRIVSKTKGSATVTGAPSWDRITSIEVETVSGAGGASSVHHDAIRVEDVDSQSPDYVLVARKVLATPVDKVDGMSQDIEFTIDVTTI